MRASLRQKRGKGEEITGRRMGIGRNIEREIAMIVIGSSAWIITCRFVKARGWRMWLPLVFSVIRERMRLWC